MKIAIDRNVPIPAYKQVVDGIAGAIARGDVSRGTRLPSVRNLAVDLGLNVNTVARAYRDLERAGVIDTMPGMGTFVANEVPDQASRQVGVEKKQQIGEKGAKQILPQLVVAGHSGTYLLPLKGRETPLSILQFGEIGLRNRLARLALHIAAPYSGEIPPDLRGG